MFRIWGTTLKSGKWLESPIFRVNFRYVTAELLLNAWCIMSLSSTNSWQVTYGSLNPITVKSQEHCGLSNYRQLDRVFNRLFQLTTKETNPSNVYACAVRVRPLTCCCPCTELPTESGKQSEMPSFTSVVRGQRLSWAEVTAQLGPLCVSDGIPGEKWTHRDRMTHACVSKLSQHWFR